MFPGEATRICVKAINNLLNDVMLIGGNQSLLVNVVKICSRYHTMDVHHEHFKGNHAKNSMPLPNSKYENVHVARVDRKLLIESSKMNALFFSQYKN